MNEDYKDIFKKHFNEHLDDTDAQEMWKAIKVRKRGGPKRRRKNKGRVIIVIILGLGFLFTTAIYNFKNKQSSNTALKSQLDKREHAQLPTSDDQPLDTQGKYVSGANKLVLENRVSQDAIPSDSKEVIEKGNLAQGKYLGDVTEQNLTKVEIQADVVVNNNLSQDAFNVDTEEETLTSDNEEDSQFLNQVVSVNGTETNTKDDQVTEGEFPSRNNLGSAKENEKIGGVEMASSEILKLSALQTFSIIPFTIEQVLPELKMTVQGIIAAPTNNGASKSKMGLSVGGSYGLLSSNFESTSGASLAYTTARAETESNLEAFTTNVLFDYRILKNISISSGLGYTRINELFQWENNFVRDNFGEHHAATEIDENGVSNFVYSTGTYQEEVSRKMNIYNKTDLVSVPLVIGLHKSVGEINVSIQGAVQANFLIGQDGYILNDKNETLVLGTDVDTKFGLGFKGGLGIEYPLTEKIGLQGNISYTKFSKNQLNVDVAYGIIDLGIALAYKF